MSTEDKFLPKDLVEMWMDDEAKKARGTPAFCLVIQKATDEERKEYELDIAPHAAFTFWKVLLDDEFHLANENYLTLVQRDGKLFGEYSNYFEDEGKKKTG